MHRINHSKNIKMKRIFRWIMKPLNLVLVVVGFLAFKFFTNPAFKATAIARFPFLASLGGKA